MLWPFFYDNQDLPVPKINLGFMEQKVDPMLSNQQH